MTVLDTFRHHYRHRDRAARAWKAAGGKVVGYLCDNVPEELIMAAGFLPYRLSGDPRVGADALDATSSRLRRRSRRETAVLASSTPCSTCC